MTLESCERSNRLIRRVVFLIVCGTIPMVVHMRGVTRKYWGSLACQEPHRKRWRGQKFRLCYKLVMITVNAWVEIGVLKLFNVRLWWLRLPLYILLLNFNPSAVQFLLQVTAISKNSFMREILRFNINRCFPFYVLILIVAPRFTFTWAIVNLGDLPSRLEFMSGLRICDPVYITSDSSEISYEGTSNILSPKLSFAVSKVITSNSYGNLLVTRFCIKRNTFCTEWMMR